MAPIEGAVEALHQMVGRVGGRGRGRGRDGVRLRVGVRGRGGTRLSAAPDGGRGP